jgi:multidrug efflux pump subunit AcrA (membrane-fusion protein)
MSVEANIVISERENVLIVPTEAVRGDTVFMLDREGRVVTRRVSVGIRGTSGVEITGGLQEGDRILAVIPPGLNGGDAVRQPHQGPMAFYRRMLWAS